MINLEKVTQEKWQPPLLRRPAPAPYFHSLYFNFSDTPPPFLRGTYLKFTPTILKRGAPNYAYSLKTLENKRFSDVLGGHRKTPVA